MTESSPVVLIFDAITAIKHILDRCIFAVFDGKPDKGVVIKIAGRIDLPPGPAIGLPGLVPFYP